jgi:hypothetical protein
LSDSAKNIFGLKNLDEDIYHLLENTFIINFQHRTTIDKKYLLKTMTENENQTSGPTLKNYIHN